MAGLATFLAGASVRADTTPDRAAAAEALFLEARGLMDQGDAAAACPKFEASLQIDEALGTLLNLANCYEQMGRTASAWGRYRQAAGWGRLRGDAKRTMHAEQRAADLEPMLARLTIELETAVGSGLVVRRGGTLVDAAAFGTAIPVDPGDQEVEASAAGRSPWHKRVTVAPGASVTVTVPSAWLGSAPFGASVHAPLSADATSSAGQPVESSAGTKWKRPTALALTAAGLVAVATGVYFGRRGSATAGEIEEACHSSRPCDWSIWRDRDARARSDVRMQWILLVAGSAAAASGSAFLIFGGSDGVDKHAGLSVGGRF